MCGHCNMCLVEKNEWNVGNDSQKKKHKRPTEEEKMKN